MCKVVAYVITRERSTMVVLARVKTWNFILASSLVVANLCFDYSKQTWLSWVIWQIEITTELKNLSKCHQILIFFSFFFSDEIVYTTQISSRSSTWLSYYSDYNIWVKKLRVRSRHKKSFSCVLIVSIRNQSIYVYQTTWWENCAIAMKLRYHQSAAWHESETRLS